MQNHRNYSEEHYNKTHDIIVKNTKAGWNDAEKEIIREMSYAKQAPKSFSIETEISANRSEPDAEVQYLQCFFPIAERIRAYYKCKTRISLYIVVHNNNDIFRISHYLFAQAICEKRFGIYVGIKQSEQSKQSKQSDIDRLNYSEISIRKQTRFGRILPLFCVFAESESEVNHYRNLADYTNCIKSSDIEKVFDDFSDHVASRNTSKSSLAENYYIYEGAEQLELMKSICLSNICCMLESFTGDKTKNQSFKKEEKNIIILKFKDYLIEKFDKMNLLSQMIWTILLRFLFEQKDIATKVNDTIQLVESIMERSLSDATAYSEGLMQLLENSCIHTQRKSAYFSIRMYSVDRFASSSKLAANLNTIIRLESKYRKVKTRIIDENINHYLEIVVMDDAYSINDIKGECDGIVNNFNRENKLKIKGMMSLEDIFEYESIETHDIAHHYGLRLFKKIVLVNNGIFIVSTPNTNREIGGVEGYSVPVNKYKKDPTGRSIDYKNNPNASNASIEDTNNSNEAEGNENNGEEKYKDLETITEYNIFLPLKYEWGHELCKGKRIKSNNSLFDIGILNQNNGEFETIKIKIKDNSIMASFKNTTEKIELVNKVNSKLTEMINDNNWYENNKIVAIKIEDCTFLDIEIFSKALFLYIAQHYIPETTNRRLLFALHFSSDYYINEFIRIFSIFYDKTGSNLYMEGVQIALCGIDKQKYTSTVKFLIAGKNIESAKKTAEIFTYYSSETSLQFVSQIRYLTRVYETNNSEVPQQFPFDLYLRKSNFESDPEGQDEITKEGELENKQIEISEWIPQQDTINSNRTFDESLFLSHMREIINSDIRKSSYGCKVSDIHIRLGSKIHMDTFYEAELLFHNIGNIYRFAFLLAKNILIDINNTQQIEKEKQSFIIVGYETYSSVLVQEIARIVSRNLNSQKVYYAIFTNDKDGKDVIYYSKEVECLSIDNKKRIKQDSRYYSVIPIGSTLSTVYKIRNVTQRTITGSHSEMKLNFAKNLVVLVVGNLKAKEEDVVKRYWDRVDEPHKIITLSVERNEENKDKETIVEYILDAKATWYDPLQCERCGVQSLEEDALIHVDKTSTIPDAIFILNKCNKKCITDLINNVPENNKRLHELMDCFTYSHTYRSDNHYQYYIDFLKYFEKVNVDHAVDKWLRECSIKINQNAFNIIISPLHETNSPFVKSVIDNSFEDSIRFLRIPIMDAYREDIRTKFSYIAEEYRRMKILDSEININVYFVDDSIVTGQTINRARNMVRMLFEDSTMPYDEKCIFKGVFLLINRCFYETINSFVENPRTDFFSFSFLLVPSYNTHNDSCPSCELKEKYDLLRKRSNTNILNNEYSRLAIKHAKKDIYEYDSWEEDQILEKHGYFAWLKQWLYFHVPAAKRTGSFTLDGFSKLSKHEYQRIIRVRDFVEDSITNNIMRWYKQEHPSADSLETLFGELYTSKDLQELYKKQVHTMVLKDLLHDSSTVGIREDCIYVIKHYIIAKRNYMRLVCTHEAYSAFEKLNLEIGNRTIQKDDDFKIVISATRKEIIRLINGKFNEISKQFKAKYKNRNRAGENDILLIQLEERIIKVEWLISYFKILSRKQLSQYYHIKQAVFTILFDFALAMLCGRRSEDLIETIEGINLLADDPSKRHEMNNLCASIQYKLFQIIIHRLSDLQSTIILKNEFIEKIPEKWIQLNEKHFSSGVYKDFCTTSNDQKYNGKSRYLKYIEMPTSSSMIFDCIKLTKWVTMSNSDESKCFLVEKNVENAMNYGENYSLNEILQIILEIEFLENTRIIYSGMEYLAMRYAQKSEKTELIEYIGGEEKACRNGDNWLYQNPISQFFRFNKICANNSTRTIAKIMQYFNEINELYEGKIPIDDLLYKYDSICDLMRDITGYSNCQIVLYKSHAIKHIVSSSVKEGHLNGMLNTAEIQKFIEKLPDSKSNLSTTEEEGGNSFKNVADMVYIGSHIRNDEENSESSRKVVLLIKMKLLRDDWKDSDELYIILERQESHNEDKSSSQIPLKELIHARNVLFLREKLSVIIQRDIYTLLSFRFEYSHIEKLNDNKLFLMHLSDLHVNVSNEKIITEFVNKMNFLAEKNIDLLLITGDVADGKNSAAEMEKNYKAANRVIKKIAEKIWTHEKYLRQDWRKRIVIIPGNHDYATMNELESVTKKRLVSSGVPASNEGDTMAKFAYYINFVRELLHIDVDELIRNDLNEIRQYKRLKTNILCLNSCAGVNQLRSNKVKLNDEVITRMMESKVETMDHTICLAHHTPQYTINYVEDMYHKSPFSGEQKAESKEKYKKYLDCFIGCCDDNDFVSDYSKNQHKVLRELHGEIKNGCPDNTQCDSIVDIEYYLSNYEDESDEKCLVIKNSVIAAKRMAEIDKRNFEETFKNLYDCYHPSFILGGHGHEIKIKEEADRQIIQADRFYSCNKRAGNEKSSICYSVLSFEEGEDNKGSYKFYEFDGEKEIEIDKLEISP